MVRGATMAAIRTHALRVLFLIGVFLAPISHAVEHTSLPPDFKHTTWTARDGAQANLNTVAQTTDGYLWLGGVNGLFRFDALHFEEIDLPHHPELRSADVYSLLATPDGGLWIGYTLGGAAYLKDGEVKLYSVSNGLAAGTVKALAEQRDGTIWAATTHGLARFRHGQWQGIDKTWQSPDDIQRMLVDGDDTVWLASQSGLYAKRVDRDVFVKLPWRHDGLTGLSESPTGAILAAYQGALQAVGHAAALPADSRPSYSGFAFDKNGSMWLLDLWRGSRLRVVPSTKLIESGLISTDKFAPIDEVTFRSLSGALTDDQGDIWIVGESGVERFSPGNLFSLKNIPYSSSGLRELESPIAPGDEGALWIASAQQDNTKSPSILYRNGQFKLDVRIQDVGSAIRVKGSVWLGGRSALWKITGDQRIRLDLPWKADFSRFQSMAGDGKGGLWVSSVRKGIFRVVDGVWTLYPHLPAALVIATDQADHLWMGCTDGRVAMFDGSTVTWFSIKQGLNIGAVTAIEARHSQIWVGGDSGIARLDGHRFTALNFEPDLAPRKIKGIVERSTGDLWLLGTKGIERISAEEIGTASAYPTHALSARLFDASDGLEGALSIRPVPALIEGTDGILWATTTSGIYHIDPEHLTRDAPPPRLGLRDFIADGRTYRVDRTATLPPHMSNLRITYAGVSLAAGEKIRYRYRLDGFDTEWQEVGTRREAFFTNLPPRFYRFRVQARLMGDAWNATESTVAFTIKPAFVETLSFVVLCVLAAAVIFWTLIGLRVWQVRRRLHLLFETRAAEREHIARDLHDTLLQSSQGLILKVHAASRRMSTDNPDRARLDAAVTNADLTLVEGRDRINELRNAGRTTAQLRSDLNAIGRSLAEETSTDFAPARAETLRELHPDIADEVFSIGREALLNAFRHAKAQHVTLELAETRNGFALTVADDGRGMNEGVLKRATGAGHWGVAGMRERVERIKGILKFLSRANNGTEVVLTIPSRTAYRRNSFWFWRT